MADELTYIAQGMRDSADITRNPVAAELPDGVFPLDADQKVSCLYCVRHGDHTSYRQGEAFLSGQHPAANSPTLRGHRHICTDVECGGDCRCGICGVAFAVSAADDWVLDPSPDEQYAAARSARPNDLPARPAPLPAPGTFGACYDCGRKYGDEYGFPDLVVSNDAWAKISPRGDEGGLLCPSCMCRRAHAIDLADIEARFRSGPFAERSDATPTNPSALPDAQGVSDWRDIELRKLWAMGHGCEGIYGDDGKLECVHTDWMQEPLDAQHLRFLSIQSQRSSRTTDAGRELEYMIERFAGWRGGTVGPPILWHEWDRFVATVRAEMRQ